MSEHLINDAVAIPVISGWVAMAKGYIPADMRKKFMPFLAMICGLVYAFSLREAQVDVIQSVITGITLGLGAVGAHSAVKNGVEKANGVTPPAA